MALVLQLIKHHSGILIPATPETSDILQSKTRLGDVLVAEFRRVRNPAFHRRFFALLNLGFEYWEPTGGAISSNERKLITGYAKFLASYGGNEGALIDAAEHYLEQVAYRRVTNGISLCKSFDAYRSWVIVEAGHFDAIQLPDGTLKKHPRSISFANMDELEFQQLYKAALDVLWRWVLSRSFRSRDEAENVAAQLLGFVGCQNLGRDRANHYRGGQMKPETLEVLRARWQRLRIYRYRGSVLVDYRIIRNFVRIYHSAGAA